MKRPELLLALVLASLAGFIGYQATTVRRRPAITPSAEAPLRDSARDETIVGVQTGSPAIEPPGDPVEMRRQIVAGRYGTYIEDVVAGHDSTILRWPDRTSTPLRVWVQPVAALADWRPENPGIAQNAFVEWSDVGIPVRFTFVSDSASANVPVVWVDRFDQGQRIGSTRLTSDGRHIVLASLRIATHTTDGRALAREVIRACVVHEVGHLLGLAHTGDTTSIMTSSAMPHKQSLGASDRATVRLLYALPGGSLR